MWSKIALEHFGGDGMGEIPLPIPNREVKPHSADGTALVTVWESRSPPRTVESPRRILPARAFLYAASFPIRPEKSSPIAPISVGHAATAQHILGEALY